MERDGRRQASSSISSYRSPASLGRRLLRAFANQPDPPLVAKLLASIHLHKQVQAMLDLSVLANAELQTEFDRSEEANRRLLVQLRAELETAGRTETALKVENDRLGAAHGELWSQYQHLAELYETTQTEKVALEAKHERMLLSDNRQYARLSSVPINVSTVSMAALQPTWISPDDSIDDVSRAPSGTIRRAAASTREIGKHKGFQNAVSCGSKERPIPGTLLRDEAFRTAELYFALLDDALVFTWMGAVMPKPGVFIEETVQAAKAFRTDLTHIPGVSQNNGTVMFDPRAAAKTQHVRKPCLVSTHGASLAYGHWISDTMTSVWLWRDALRRGDIALLMPYQQVPWTIAILQAFDIPLDACIQPESQVMSMDLCIVSASCDMRVVRNPNDVLVEMADFILNKIGVERNSASGKLLYLSRSDPAAYWKRSISNEAELLAMLLPMGFEILTPGQISFREQAELFAQARMIVAPHGSAFMNLIFAPKDCMVIDLMSDTWIDLPEHTWIYRLTSLMQLRYAVILGEVTWTGHRDRYAEGVVFPDNSFNYHIDVEKVKRAVLSAL